MTKDELQDIPLSRIVNEVRRCIGHFDGNPIINDIGNPSEYTKSVIALIGNDRLIPVSEGA